MLLAVGFVVDNVLPRLQGEKRVVFLARMTRKKGLYDGANFSHRELILFRHQLRVKIKCDSICLDRIIFDRRWEHAANLVVRKEAMLESSLLPLPAHGDYGPSHSGPHPR